MSRRFLKIYNRQHQQVGTHDRATDTTLAEARIETNDFLANETASRMTQVLTPEIRDAMTVRIIALFAKGQGNWDAADQIDFDIAKNALLPVNDIAKKLIDARELVLVETNVATLLDLDETALD